MAWLTDPDIWLSFLTLTMLEIVLGIDNLVFISVMSGRLDPARAARARRLGLIGALATRIALLSAIAWIVGLSAPLFHFADRAVSLRDLVLLGGGLFLLAKATREIHGEVEGRHERLPRSGDVSLTLVVGQIMALDVVFSLDSVITAVGLSEHLPVMIAAVSVAILVMLWAAEPTTRFIRAHPTARMLAFAFLLLIGVALIADGLHFHIPRGYLYFAIAFSMLVEFLNQLAARRRRAGTKGDGRA